MKRLRNIKRGIQNLIKYFHVIWNDRDWDQNYIYYLLLTKITSMIKFYETSSVLMEEDKNKILVELDTVKCALQRAIANDFCEEEYANHYEVYPFDINLMNRMGDKERISFLTISYLETLREKENRHILFNTIRDHIVCWWD